MRHRRLVNTVGVIFILLGALLIYAMIPGRVTFTVTPQTTIVTDRLDSHGFVDYPTGLHDRLSKGITPENNANVLIWKALGPHPEGATMSSEFFQWLGYEPPEQGDYMVPFGSKYLKEHANIDGDRIQEYYDRMYRAGNWPWAAKDEPEVADWLKENEKPLAQLIEATRRPEYYNPLVPKRTEEWSPGLMGALLPNVQKCREFAAALTCRAMLRVHEGKIAEAWQDLLACHRLGRLLGRGATLIESLVGFAIDAIASKADMVYVDRAKLTSTQVSACLQDLRNLPPMPGIADKIDLAERFMCLDSMMLVIRHGRKALDGLSGGGAAPAPEKGFWDKVFTPSINWDPAFRNANRWYDRYVAAMRVPDRATREHELADLTEELKKVRSQLQDAGTIKKAIVGSSERGEIAGDIIITLLLPSVEKVQGAADRCEQQQRNLRLAFALAAYQRDQGRYPGKLDELAPKYIDKIPDDLFADKPLTYKREDKGFLLYSVGPNGNDDGGHVPEPRIKK